MGCAGLVRSNEQQPLRPFLHYSMTGPYQTSVLSLDARVDKCSSTDVAGTTPVDMDEEKDENKMIVDLHGNVT